MAIAGPQEFSGTETLKFIPQNASADQVVSRMTARFNTGNPPLYANPHPERMAGALIPKVHLDSYY